MTKVLVVINMLVMLTITKISAQDSIILNKPGTKEVHYKKLISIQQKYLGWVDRRDKEFPFGVPAIAYNKYDGVQIGAALINLKQPVKHIDFTASLLYGIKSHKVNGTANVDYYIRLKKSVVTLIKPGVKFQSFTWYDHPKPLKYYSISPSIEIVLNHRTEKLEKLEHRISFTNHIVLKKELVYSDGDAIVYVLKDTLTRFYANVFKYTFSRKDDNFPVSASLSFEQTKFFVKTYFEANSFIRYQLKNYNTGVHIRLFVGGFLWRSDNFHFRLYPDVGFNLNGKRGEQDYLYSDYYFGRYEQENFSARQITKTDGFFKVSTPLNGIETGQTVDWLMAMNFKVDFPIHYVPVKLFFDLGYSYDNHLNPVNLLPVKGFQFDGGFMFSFFDEGFEIYFPLIYSKEYKAYYKADAPKFKQKISFLLDLHKLELHKKIRDMRF
ncbi:MAG: family metallopeptidase [Bacteroidota bacterium]|nr:family metallopeptidase [Bacteroidota bacterium]